MRPVVVAVLFASLALAGCGAGHAHRSERAARGAENEQAERDAALRRVSPRDRVAYYQVATTTGLLRERAALASVRGRSRPGLAGELRAARTRLRATHPRDARLGALRRRLLAALAAPRSPHAELAAANRIARGLDRLVRREPAYSALVPD